jgi:hypothetical protein
MTRIALLGWGSLIWDARPEFDRWHDSWRRGGPHLKLEFSRISTTRHGALTLVIDPVCGAWNSVCYSVSKRSALSDAVGDLQRREGTIDAHIGYVSGTSRRCRDPASGEAIEDWVARNGIEAAVWTDLPGNFAAKTGQIFSIEAAIAYLRALDADATASAVAYISGAPDFVRTPLRDALSAEPWFAAAATRGPS